MQDLSPTKWSAVRGKSPTKRELSAWTEKQWICFIQFCLVFIEHTDERTKDGTGWKMTFSRKKWREAEEFLDMPNHPFQEFLYRIDKFSDSPLNTEKKFFAKLSSMMKFCLGYLRHNPSLVSPTMRSLIEPNPRLNWCLVQTKIIDTAVGQVVVSRTDRPVGVVHDNESVASHEKRLFDASIRATDILTKLMENVDARSAELNKMPLKDVLMAIGRMSYVFSVGRQIKIGKGIFKQINIHAAGREELEQAMLSMNKDE